MATAKRRAAPKRKSSKPRVESTEIVIDQEGDVFVVVIGTHVIVEPTLRKAEVMAILEADKAFNHGAKRVVVLNVTRATARTVNLTATMAKRMAALARVTPEALHGWTERMAGMPRRPGR